MVQMFLELIGDRCNVSRGRIGQTGGVRQVCILLFITGYAYFRIRTNTDWFDAIQGIVGPFSKGLTQQCNAWYQEQHNTPRATNFFGYLEGGIGFTRPAGHD